MWRKPVTIAVVCVVCAFGAARAADEPGVGEQIGEKIDKGLDRLGKNLKQGWADIRQSVDNMSTQARVYSRIHWDKALQSATVDIEVRDEKTVVLKGSVPDQIARLKAVQLAKDTVGVNQVVDNLAVGRKL